MNPAVLDTLPEPVSAVDIWAGIARVRLFARRMASRRKAAKPNEILEKAPQAEFEDIAGIFIARFGRPKRTAPEAAVKAPGVSVKSSVKTGERILSLVAEAPGISMVDLAGHLHLTPRAVEKQMANLQRAGRLRRIGPDKGGHWEVQP